VVLKTTAQTGGTAYELTINNVTDVPGNKLDPSPTKKTFTGWLTLKGYLVREFYGNISGVGIGDLTNNAAYKNGTPTSVSAITGKFESPTDVADNYGIKVYGLLMPPTTGDYTFYVASDDYSSVYLSTDDKPANIRPTPIANVADWTSSREYNKLATQKSAPIKLEAGKSYYVEALMKEGGGGDNLALAWRMPGENTAIANGAEPIPGDYFGIYINPDNSKVEITQQPANVTVEQNRPATFTVVATGSSDVTTSPTYQWQKNGADIAGATGASYTLPVAALADNGAKFRCVVKVPAKSVTSAEATLTVNADTTPPDISSAAGLIGNGEVYVYFNELMDPVSASTAANYGVSGGVVSDASLSTDGKSVVLSVVGLAGDSVSVAANKVKDLAGNAMTQVKIVTAQLSKLTALDVGTQDPATLQFTDPIERGATWARNAKDFDMIAGGTDIWNNADGMHYAYVAKNGNFDMIVRVARVDRTDHWTKAGLMVREKLTGASREACVVVCPTTGANMYQTNYREVEGGGTIDNWAGIGAANTGAPAYPNAWIRLQRAGNVFTASRSDNGTDWVQVNKAEMTFPLTLYVGMAATSHNNGVGQTTYVEFRDFSIKP
jgi:hypothetical protein